MTPARPGLPAGGGGRGVPQVPGTSWSVAGDVLGSLSKGSSPSTLTPGSLETSSVLETIRVVLLGRELLAGPGQVWLVSGGGGGEGGDSSLTMKKIIPLFTSVIFSRYQSSPLWGDTCNLPSHTLRLPQGPPGPPGETEAPPQPFWRGCPDKRRLPLAWS